jgi:hypothetical protein
MPRNGKGDGSGGVLGPAEGCSGPGEGPEQWRRDPLVSLPGTNAVAPASLGGSEIVLVGRLSPTLVRAARQWAGDPHPAIVLRGVLDRDSPAGLGPVMCDLVALTWQTMSGRIAPLSPRRLDFNGQISF